MEGKALHILLVEDNPGDAFLVEKSLREAASFRFGLTHAECLAEAFSELAGGDFDVILLDLSLPDSAGLGTFTAVHYAASEIPILVLTGLADEEMALETVHHGAQDYLVKGELSGRAIARCVSYALERKRREAELRQVTELQRAILDSANYTIISTDTEGVIQTFNAAAERWLGYPADEVVGVATPMLIHEAGEVERRSGELTTELGRSVAPGIDVFVARARAGVPDEREWTYVRKDGSRFPVLLSVTALRDAQGWITGYLGIASDISERKRAEVERARLLASEREKAEQLKLSVREAHHRIKNNLQAISDLLYLELESGASASPEEALRESISRVQAIALVHDLLTQHEDVQTVDTRAVLERLVPMVLQGAGAAPASLDLKVEVASVRLSSKRVTTVALIVNELVSNAAKHAFRMGQPATLSIRLLQEGDDLVLLVKDNGPGLPFGFDLDTDAHVGLDVVRVMTERDLGGQLTLTTEHGLRAEVRFPW